MMSFWLRKSLTLIMQLRTTKTFIVTAKTKRWYRLMYSSESKRPMIDSSTADISPTKAQICDVATQTNNETSKSKGTLKGAVMDRTAQRFEETVKTVGFVDRSLLIKELLEPDVGETIAMMFAPTKFGKSINLDMIRCFCDVERNESGSPMRKDTKTQLSDSELKASPKMEIFVQGKCKILEDNQFVKDHFGRHPVIFIDFKNFIPDTKEDAIFECAGLMQQLYNDHKYLLNSNRLNSDHKDLITCSQYWCSYNVDLPIRSHILRLKLMAGFRDLIRSLRIHWGSDPILLVDEVDRPIINAMEQNVKPHEIQNIGKVISNLLCAVLKTADKDIKLAGALLTGIFYVQSMGLSDITNTTPPYFLHDPRFSKYYGMTESEVGTVVDALFHDLEREQVKQNIKNYYNGYYQDMFEDEEPSQYARYCLYSVLSYIDQMHRNKNKKEFTFWMGKGYLPKVMKILKDSMVYSDICTLMFNGSLQIIYKKELDGTRLSSMFGEESQIWRDDVFNFLLQGGYLARDPMKKETTVKKGIHIYVKIPNAEVAADYFSMFEDHCKVTFFNNQAMTETRNFLKKLSTYKKDDPLFTRGLKTLFQTFSAIFKTRKNCTEREVVAILYSMMCEYGNFEKCKLEYPVVESFGENVKTKYAYIDLWMKDGDFAIIFEVKYNDHTVDNKIGHMNRSSLAAAEDIISLLPGREGKSFSDKGGTSNDLKLLDATDKYFLVGLSVDGNGNVHMLAFLNSQDWKDVIAINPEANVKILLDKALGVGKYLILQHN